MQFHTPLSWWANKATHPLYERQRVLARDSIEALALAAKQEWFFSFVRRPLGPLDDLFGRWT